MCLASIVIGLTMLGSDVAFIAISSETCGGVWVAANCGRTASQVAGLPPKVAAAGQAPVGMERFRPNLVLSGLAAHEEDQIRNLRIDVGGRTVTLQLVKPCGRCSIPDVNPNTGETDDAVGQVLAAYRRDAGLKGEVTFGMNAMVTEGLVAPESEEAEPVLRVSQAVEMQPR